MRASRRKRALRSNARGRPSSPSKNLPAARVSRAPRYLLPRQKESPSFSFFTPTRCCPLDGRARSAARSPRGPSAARSGCPTSAAARACAGSPSGRMPARRSRTFPTVTSPRSCVATSTKDSAGTRPGRSSTTGTSPGGSGNNGASRFFGTRWKPRRAATSNVASSRPCSGTGGFCGRRGGANRLSNCRSATVADGRAQRQDAPRSRSDELEDVPHLGLLRRQVIARSVRGRDFERDALDDLEAVAVDRDVLGRVVREETDLPYAEVPQNLAADAVVADVGRETELLVRGHRVEALLLQLVGAQLVDETDAAALLKEIEEHALALPRDQLHRALELRPAIAALRAEDVAREAGGVHAYEDGLVLAPLSRHERHVLLVRDVGPIGDDADQAVARRQRGGGDALHEALRAHPVADDVSHRDDRDAVLLREDEEVRDAGHRPVLVHDLADDGGGREAGDAREIDGCLRLARPLQDAALPRPQRERVAGPQQVLRLRLRVDERLHRHRYVGRRDAGRGLAARLDGHGEGRSVVGRVLLDHRVQIQLVAALLRQRDADEPAALAGHEVDRGRRDVLGREADGAFVLAILVVDDDHEAALLVGSRSLGDGNESHAVRPFGIPRRRGGRQASIVPGGARSARRRAAVEAESFEGMIREDGPFADLLDQCFQKSLELVRGRQE